MAHHIGQSVALRLRTQVNDILLAQEGGWDIRLTVWLNPHESTFVSFRTDDEALKKLLEDSKSELEMRWIVIQAIQNDDDEMRLALTNITIDTSIIGLPNGLQFELK